MLRPQRPCSHHMVPLPCCGSSGPARILDALLCCGPRLPARIPGAPLSLRPWRPCTHSGAPVLCCGPSGPACATAHPAFLAAPSSWPPAASSARLASGRELRSLPCSPQPFFFKYIIISNSKKCDTELPIIFVFFLYTYISQKKHN